MIGTLRIMGAREGDKTLTWDTAKPKSVEKAKSEVDSLKEKGYRFFQVKEETVQTKGEPVDDFDFSTPGQVIAVPPMRGG